MSQPNWTGQILRGRYQIEELLGEGGMSSVYKATDPNLRRSVAVKLIHTNLSRDAEFVSRFEEEAAAIAQLDHPNVIKVFDFDKDDDTYYMVMEFIPGETLQETLLKLNETNQGPSIEETIRIAASICDALDYAHQLGTIHRDVKPANIMVNARGQAILMDFGIAKIIGGKHQTATGAIIGTVLYMSPEHAQGGIPDGRVDIYSLGVVIFEMVSGRPPFDADSVVAIILQHLNDPVPDLTELNPDTPQALKSIVEKALAKDPNDRYKSAADMAVALRKVPDHPKAAVLVQPDPPSQKESVSEASVLVQTIIEPPTQSAQTKKSLAQKRSPIPPPPAPPQPRRTWVKYLTGAMVIFTLCFITYAGILYFQLRGQPTAAAILEPTSIFTAIPSPPVGVTAAATPVPSNTILASDAETATALAMQVPTEPALSINININLRAGPSLGYDVVWTFESGTETTIIGRFGGTNWILVRINDPTRTRKQCGWVSAELLGFDVSILALVETIPDVYNCPAPPNS